MYLVVHCVVQRLEKEAARRIPAKRLLALRDRQVDDGEILLDGRDRGRIERHGAPRVVRLQSLKRPDAICRSTRGVTNYFGEIACRTHCLLAGELVKVEP